MNLRRFNIGNFNVMNLVLPGVPYLWQSDHGQVVASIEMRNERS